MGWACTACWASCRVSRVGHPQTGAGSSKLDGQQPYGTRCSGRTDCRDNGRRQEYSGQMDCQFFRGNTNRSGCRCRLRTEHQYRKDLAGRGWLVDAKLYSRIQRCQCNLNVVSIRVKFEIFNNFFMLVLDKVRLSKG